LSTKNVEEGIFDKLTGIFRDCEMARYTPSGVDRAKRQHIFNDMREVIDYLERRKI